MPTTSTTTDEGKPLKTDRRINLDGGLDTRSSALDIDSDKATALGNFRFTTEGALQKRKGGRQLCTVAPYSSVSFIPTPIAQDGGAGALAAGTYQVRYVMGTVSSYAGRVGPSPASVALVLGASKRISITIPAPNSGEGFGRLTNGFNDAPGNAGFLLAGNQFGIYAKKSGDPNYTLQTVADLGNSPSGAPANVNGRVFDMNSYTTNGAVLPADLLSPIPVRALFWHPLVDTLVGVSAETPYALQGALSSVQYLALSNDSAGNPFGFSRMPTKMACCFVDRCMILSDAVGRPKILNSPADSQQVYGVSLPTSWSFRQLGAAAPAAAPTNGAKTAGALTGTYQYVTTFVYQRDRQDGTSFLSESNSSAALTVVYAGQQATISIVAPSESGIVSWNLYRTIAGETQFFLLATTVIGTTSFADNQADTALTGQQPPDKGGKIPNDVPRQGLAMVTEHAGRAFGVDSNVLRKAGGGSAFSTMTRTRALNQVMYSKTRFPNDLVAAGATANITVAPGDFGNVDAWPSFFVITCGNASPITDLVSFRGVLYVFKEDEIGVIEGATDQDFTYRTIWTGTGAMENSIIKVGNYLLAFDQALGPIQVSGYSVTDLGYETIQPDWLQAVTTTSGESISGGGRGSTGVVSATWDPVNAEARWVISDFQTNPDSAYAMGSTPTFFEYVCRMAQAKPSEAFSRFTGTVQPNTFATSNTATAFVVVPGNYSLTTNESGRYWNAGDAIILQDATNPANYATGTINTYGGTTLIVTVTFASVATVINSFVIGLIRVPTDRRILAQDACIVGSAAVPFRPRDIVFGDYQGRLVEDSQVEYDFDGITVPTYIVVSTPQPISIRATFPFFFGDNPELVKQFRYLYAMLMMGATTTDAMTFVMQSLSKDGTAPVTITTFNGATAQAGIHQLKYMALPALIDGTNSKDRAMQIVISGSAQSGPMLLEELCVRYQDTGDRSKP